MKKILSLVLVLALMLSFVSCTKKADYFKDNLKDADYEVSTVKGDDLEEMFDEMCEALDIDLKGEIEYMLNAYNEDGDFISIYCFEKLADAKTVEKDIGDLYDEDDDVVIERKGKIILVATSDDAIDAAYGK